MSVDEGQNRNSGSITATQYSRQSDWDDEISLVRIFGILYRRRWIAAPIGIVVTLLSIVLAISITPRYLASVVLMDSEVVDQPSSLGGLASQVGGLAALAGVSLQSTHTIRDEALAVLQSRGFIQSFIQDNKLLPILYPKRWDATQSKWSVEAQDIPTMNDGYKLFVDDILSVDTTGTPGVINVSVLWTDPAVGATWANQLVDRLNAYMRTIAINDSSNALVHLQNQLATTTVIELRQVLFHLIEKQTTKATLAETRPDYAFRVIDPAIPQDLKSPDRPQKVLIVCAGFLVGMILSILAALAVDVRATKSVSG